jgi:N-sulfoglucosamine sulfohydrolase
MSGGGRLIRLIGPIRRISGLLPPLPRNLPRLRDVTTARRFNLSNAMPRLFLSLLLAAATFHAASGAEKRPNILFLFADDWGRYASAYRAVDGPGGISDVIETPNIDKVAQRGVIFRNAHVTAPSCTPCRSSLLSGQYFWRTGRGAILQGAFWDSKIPTYPLLLRDAGYHIGKMFKVWSPGTPADEPYGGQKYAFEKHGRSFNQFSQAATKAVEAGKTPAEAKEQLYSEVRQNFADFLAAKPKDTPFCFWFGPTNTHRKWIKGSGKALWGIEPDALKGKLPAFLPDVPEVREDVADYLGEAQAVDGAIGTLLAEVAKAGELENTLIVISGDHGMPGMPHGKCNLYDFGTGVSLVIAGPMVKGGRVVDDFVNLTALAPTFLEAGGVAVPDVMTGRSLMSVLTSEKAGLVDPERTWVVTGRERHVESARDDMLPYPQRSLSTPTHHLIINFEPDRWPMGNPYELDGSVTEPTPEALTEDTRITFKDMDSSPTKAWLIGQRNNPQWRPFYELAFGKRPRLELYDTLKDPSEVHNLADDPAHADLRNELEARLMKELTTTGDPRVTGDGKTYDRPPFAGPLPPDSPKGKAQKKGKGKKK